MDNEEFIVTTEEVTAYLSKCEQLHEEFHEALPEVESLQEIIELNWTLAAGLINAVEELKTGTGPKH
jgi:hypothetical protein